MCVSETEPLKSYDLTGPRRIGYGDTSQPNHWTFWKSSTLLLASVL